jgi:hypothetical protein
MVLQRPAAQRLAHRLLVLAQYLALRQACWR